MNRCTKTTLLIGFTSYVLIFCLMLWVFDSIVLDLTFLENATFSNIASLVASLIIVLCVAKFQAKK